SNPGTEPASSVKLGSAHHVGSSPHRPWCSSITAYFRKQQVDFWNQPKKNRAWITLCYQKRQFTFVALKVETQKRGGFESHPLLLFVHGQTVFGESSKRLPDWQPFA